MPKEETQLSSSRRNRNRKGRLSGHASGVDGGASSIEPESPHFHDALEGLLYLSKSPSAASPSALHARAVNAQLEEQVARAEAELGAMQEVGRGRVQRRGQKTLTSSVSSSSGDDSSEGEDENDSDSGSGSAMEL